MLRRTMKAVACLPLLLAVACGGGAGANTKSATAVGKDGKRKIAQRAKKAHGNALKTFVKHEKAFDWSEASCKSVAKAFIDASAEQQTAGLGPLPSALYNAGISYMRCGLEEEAVAMFKKATAADSGFHRGRAQVALFDYTKTGNLDSTITQLEQIIRDARFQNVEALVSVAALQMQRDSDQSTDDGADDFERAKKNIQRALAIDDNFMPAFNQLATYYMEMAKKKAGTKGRRRLMVAGSKKKKVNQQQLELAALVASQAILKNGNYAPIHNTAGLIQVQMENYNGAVKSFAKARKLDRKFFEAHMNYAALNLAFRGFKEAEVAYHDALKLHPEDYEAHLGLGLAIRGQIDDSNFDKYVGDAQKELDKCKKLNPSRPEAYYNEAILTQEYKAKAAGDPLKSIPTLKKAIEKYESFISKAGDQTVFAEAVKRSKDRAQDIKDTIVFMEEGEKGRLAQIEMEKQMKAEEEARKKAEADAKKAEADAKKAEADAKNKAEADAKKAEEAKKKAAADAEAAKKAAAAKPAAAPAKKAPAKKAPAKK